MLPFFKYSWIFKSRWLALVWAAGICWLALDFVGAAPDAARKDADQANDASGAAVSPEQAQQVADALRKIQ